MKKTFSRAPLQDQEIETLLQDPELSNNPLLPILRKLYEETQEHKQQLQKLMRISDAFDGRIFEESNEAREQFDKQSRRLQKIARISDMYQQNMVDVNEKLEYYAQHDVLTELPNRRYAIDRLKEFEAMHKRKQVPFCIALLDIDHFKVINDKFGHEFGDKVLKIVASELKNIVRITDVCSRWGGEEFLLIVPDLNIDASKQMIERILEKIRRVDWKQYLEVSSNAPQLLGELTLSAGLTTFQAGESFDETIKRADKALYLAKYSGRNRIEIDRSDF
ncbi:biofilm regulation diguanylate cyclase SiaD [Methylophaga thiooxydans]|uniref:biofilm regulation diguanylate cyclase SiaD n=1 Tax=Methylophaga thiooxydans TaxID=392484 RepID=UPI00068F1CDF|nr:biofilm regulation diguanylate cyclase SiaD [Methylophaga thiooxydans]